MICSGYNHKAIARKLGISSFTVKSNIYQGPTSIFAKLDVENMSQAVAKWVKQQAR